MTFFCHGDPVVSQKVQVILMVYHSHVLELSLWFISSALVSERSRSTSILPTIHVRGSPLIVSL